MTSYTGLNHKFSILLYFNIKLSVYGILTCCLNYICDVYYNYLSIITICFTNCYEAWLELHVYFILTNYDVSHAIMISICQIYTFLKM